MKHHRNPLILLLFLFVLISSGCATGSTAGRESPQAAIRFIHTLQEPSVQLRDVQLPAGDYAVEVGLYLDVGTGEYSLEAETEQE